MGDTAYTGEWSGNVQAWPVLGDLATRVAAIERQLSALTLVVGQIARLEARLTALEETSGLRIPASGDDALDVLRADEWRRLVARVAALEVREARLRENAHAAYDVAVEEHDRMGGLAERLAALEAEYAGPNWRSTILAHDAAIAELERQVAVLTANARVLSRRTEGLVPEVVTGADVADGRVSLAGRPVVVVPSGVHDVDAYYRDDEPADVTAGIVLPQGGSVVSPPAPAQPAPLPGPVADAVACLRRDNWYGAADALAAHATAQRERDARLAALCREAADIANTHDHPASAAAFAAAAAELDGGPGDGGGA